jgi:hypothetical protein
VNTGSGETVGSMSIARTVNAESATTVGSVATARSVSTDTAKGVSAQGMSLNQAGRGVSSTLKTEGSRELSLSGAVSDHRNTQVATTTPAGKPFSEKGENSAVKLFALTAEPTFSVVKGSFEDGLSADYIYRSISTTSTEATTSPIYKITI